MFSKEEFLNIFVASAFFKILIESDCLKSGATETGFIHMHMYAHRCIQMCLRKDMCNVFHEN